MSAKCGLFRILRNPSSPICPFPEKDHDSTDVPLADDDTYVGVSVLYCTTQTMCPLRLTIPGQDSTGVPIEADDTGQDSTGVPLAADDTRPRLYQGG